MSTVNAPYPSMMEDISDSSIEAMERIGLDVRFLNRDGDNVGQMTVQSPPSSYVAALVTVGAFDCGFREALVPDWYRPGQINTFLPATSVISSTITAMAYSRDNAWIAAGYASSIILYLKNSDNTLTDVSPASQPTVTTTDLAFSPDGQYLACACSSNSPSIIIYKKTANTTVWTKLTDPTTLPASSPQSIAWSPDGQYLAVGTQGSSRLYIYKRAGDVFTYLPAAPNVLPSSGSIYRLAWSPNGKYLAFVGDVLPFVTVYKQAGDTLTKLPDLPNNQTSTQVRSVSWSPDSQYLAFGTYNGGPWNLFIYKRAGDNFNKLTDPVYAHAGLWDLAFSPDGQYLAVTQNGGFPALLMYKKFGDTFVRISDAGSGYPAGPGKIAWSADGKYLAIGASGGNYLYIMKSSFGALMGAAVPITQVP